MENESMYAELLELITTDSASGKESAIARLVMGKLEALGFTVTTDNAGETFGGECGNVLGVREGELDGALLLCSHMDRVPEGLGIHPVERDGVLYSDGSTILAADDISGVCAIFDGLRRVLAAKVPLPRLEVLFTVGEETGLYGAKAMDLSKLHAKMGYFFDSPGSVGRFVHGAPGLYQLNAEITGRSAHAGNEPEKGVDAARTMCLMLSTLRQGRLDPISTANFPILRTGSTARNVVCDFASFQGEARSRDVKRLEDYGHRGNCLPESGNQVPGRNRRRRNGRQHLQRAGHYLRGCGHRLYEKPHPQRAAGSGGLFPLRTPGGRSHRDLRTGLRV